MGYKVILGALATGIALVSYVPYFKDIFAGKTKPHAFSWLVWTILTVISFWAQISDNAGPGAWVTGFTAVIAAAITGLAVVKGRKNIVKADWFLLAGAGLAMVMWYITKGPLVSVVLVTVTDALGFVPTFRKSFWKPREETLITYVLSGSKYVVAMFALERVSVITALYPAYLILANGVFVSMLVIRRKQLGG